MRKLHVATSRPIGERCIAWAKASGFQLVAAEQCDVFVSVMFDRLVSEQFLSNRKAYNFHPGILPEYRGSGAYSWAIINGERETGVTLHEIDRDIDHGPIVEIRRFQVKPSDTAGSLFRQAENVMFLMFKRWLPEIAVSDPSAVPQDESRSGIYYRKDLEGAKDITRLVRAFDFPGKEPLYFISRKGDKVPVIYT